MFRPTTAVLAATVSFLTCLTAGCGDKQDPLGEYSLGAPSDSETAVSYAQTIAPMMAASCAMSSCHGGAGPAAGVGLDTHEKVKANASASNAAIQAESMPIGSKAAALSETDRANFAAWVNAGSPNN